MHINGVIGKLIAGFIMYMTMMEIYMNVGHEEFLERMISLRLWATTLLS